MNIEIICVGTELLLGEIINTNVTYLQKMCKDLGFNVYFSSVVGDNKERVKSCLKTAFERGANCVITTGGLGPTQDDLTKELSAEFLGLELKYNEEEAIKVREKCLFLSSGKSISDNNFKQAFFPKECYVLENEVGTANGCIMNKDEKMIINLPGPPKEMKYIVDNVLMPYLSKYRQDIIYTYDYLIMGIGESRIDDVLEELINNQTEVSIALYASEESVRVRLGCKASSSQIADEKMQSIKDIIEEKLSSYIIKEKNLKEELYKIMPPYHFNYLSTLKMRDSFILGKHFSEDEKSLSIDVDLSKHRLGEIVIIDLKYQGEEMNFEIPMLKQADLSYEKLEGRLISSIYSFLNNIQN